MKPFDVLEAIFDESLYCLTNEQFLHYVHMRKSGESHNLSLMLASRTFPAVRGTDSDFMKGSHIQEGPLAEYRHRAAQAAGVDTNGKRYIAGLARFPNDPEAWVSSTSDVRRICADRGWNCHGAVEYEAPDSYVVTDDNRDLKSTVAKDVVREAVEDRLRDYDVHDITPRLAMDITEAETKRLNGDPAYDDLKVSDYSYEEAMRLAESGD